MVPERLALVRRLRVAEPQPPWRRWAGRTLKGLVYALAVAVAAWCTGLLGVAWHFQQVAPWGWLNSLVLMPLAFVLMVCGFVRVMVGLVWPLAGAWMGPLLDGISGWMAGLVHGLAAWPGASIAVPRPPLWLMLVVAAAIVYLVWLARSGAEENQGRSRVWRLNVAVLLGLALVTLLRPLPAASGGLIVDVLAVGHGSAVVIRTPNGQTLLYDAGSASYVDAGRSVVVPALLAGRVDAVTAAIVSHLNTDHYNGMPTVLDAVPTSHVLVSTHAAQRAQAGSSAARLLKMLRDRDVPVVAVVAGDRLRLDQHVACEVLWPPDAQGGPELPPNDASVVLRIEHAGRSVLLCGDVERTAQESLMHHPHIHADVLVAPHHGKVMECTAEFVRAVSPQVVVSSSGYSQAARTAEWTPLLAGAAYFSTADHGAIRINLSQDRCWVGPVAVPPAHRALRGPVE
jgi:competence protein ComEC